MFRNYLKIAWRSLSKHRLVKGITISGLSVGVACCLLIGLWVLDELSYDRFLPHTDRVYRLESKTRTPDGSQINLPSVGWPVGKILQADYPEVERLTYVKGWTPQLNHQGAYVQERALMADEHFLAVLGYELAQGNPQTALREPFSVILSPEAEEKYFGRGNGMGKVLMVNDTLPHRVTGVFRNVPRNGHLQFTMIRSLASLHALYPQDMEYEYASGWFDLNVANYVLLRPGSSGSAFAAKISGLVEQRAPETVKKTGMNSKLSLRPLPDVYLRSNMPTENGPIGNSRSLYLLGSIGIGILLIAGLNVINLSTAQASQRAKEVGVKKALGGLRSQLVSQFMVEAGLVCGLATLLGLVAAGLLLPFVQTFTGKLLTYTDLFSPVTFGLVLGSLALLVPLTGLYPAFVLASYQPIAVLKGGRSTGQLIQLSGLLRKGLVVTQFMVSVGLLICMLVAWQQVKFMGRQPLGFDQHKVVVVDLHAVSGQGRNAVAQRLRNELITYSQIPMATACTAVPGQTGWDGQFAYGEGNAPGNGILVEHIPVDASYIKTLRLPMLAGRDFSLNSKADENKSFLINEMAMKAFGWSVPATAIGKRLSVSGVNGNVIGVLRNYHQHSLQATIRPVVLNIMPVATTVAFRYEGNKTGAAISHLEASWKRVAAGYPLTYTFLDSAFQQQYVKEQRLIETFSMAAGLAIFIACLGLFGLATFTAEQRTKEIGVRKVLGASVASIVTLLSKDFLKLIGIAIIIASPIAWYAMNRWLQDFAYKIEIEWWMFALAGLLAVGIALLTVSFQSIKAALMNPVKSLKTE